MLIHLLQAHPFDAAIWIVIASLTLVGALALHHSKLSRMYRAFSLYVHFHLGAHIVLMTIPVGEGFRIFTWVSYSVSTVVCLLMALCIADIYSRTIGPMISLPAWVPRNLAALLSAAAAVSLGLGLIFRPIYGSSGQRVLMLSQEVMVPAMAAALWILIYKARRMGICWWPRVAQITTGFVLTLSVNAITTLAIVSGKGAGWPLQRVGWVATGLGLSWWSWKLWEKEPALEKASDEEDRALVALYAEEVAVLQDDGVIQV